MMWRRSLAMKCPAQARTPAHPPGPKLRSEADYSVRCSDPDSVEGEWEVMTHLATLHGAKSLLARVRRAGEPAVERDVTWPAHVRVEIRRGPSQG